MRIDLQDRRLRIAAGVTGFAALVAWLVPPTTPQSLPSPLLPYAKIDSHRDDAGAAGRDRRTTVWSADAWKRWYAGEARPPTVRPAYADPVPPATERAARRPRLQPTRPRDRQDDDGWSDRDWEEREADRQRWMDERAEREARREAEREDRRWEREQARRDREEYRAWERREAERRTRRYPDDDRYDEE